MLIQEAPALRMLDVWIATGCAALALLGCHRSRSVLSVSTPSVCAFPPPLKEAGLVSSTASTPFRPSGCRVLDICPGWSHERRHVIGRLRRHLGCSATNRACIWRI